MALLEAGEPGLTSAEAATRLERHGPNRLPQQPPPPVWLIALRQFRSPLALEARGASTGMAS